MTPLYSSHEMEAKLVEMHQSYCALTGRDEKFQQFIREWFDFAQHYDQETLENVLRYIIGINKSRSKQYRINVALRNILDLPNFETHRADWAVEAKAKAAKSRAFKPNAGQVALSQMRHEEDVKPPDQPPRMTKELILSNLDKLKGELENQ